MSKSDPHLYLEDPLSQISRLERRNLLIASTLGLLVGHVGLVPTSITALGLEFTAPAQNAFLILMALLVAYLIFSFGIYALADFFIWRKRYYDCMIAREDEANNWTQEDQEEYNKLRLSVPPIHWYWQKSPFIAGIRIAFEFLLPLLIGIYTALILIFRAWNN